VIRLNRKELSELAIIFRDARLLAVDKPSGLSIHRGLDRSRGPTLVDAVKEVTGLDVAYPVHRIDRGASGVVLFALDPETARLLQQAFEQGKAGKTYLALVRGICPESGEIDSPVPRDEDGERVPAVTRFRRLACARTEPREVSLVEVTPLSGRFHQIRRHLAHINHPIIGDSNYGKGVLNRSFCKLHGLCRLALHASTLEFVHPFSVERLVLDSPLPEDLRAPLARMGLANISI
jgi:tRNA pseudouridine65 synthase